MLACPTVSLKGAVTTPAPTKRRRKWAWLAAAVLGLGAAIGLVLWQHDVAFEEASTLCRASRRAPTLRERAALLDRAAPLRARIGIFGDDTIYCQMAEWDLEQMLGGRPWDRHALPPGTDLATRVLGPTSGTGERGACVTYPLREVPCRCQDQRFPEDWQEPGSAECGPEGLRQAEPE